MKVNKVFIVTNIPNPYRIPLLNELNRHCNMRGIDLKVLFGSEYYARRKFIINKSDIHFAHAFLKKKIKKVRNSGKYMFTYPGLLKIVQKEKPDIIITLGFGLCTIKLWLYSLIHPVPYIIWSGSVQERSRLFSSLRRLIRSILIRKASAFIVYGTKAKEYLIGMGAEENEIFIAINTVDTKFFRDETASLRAMTRQDKNIHHITYLGYFANLKNVNKVLYAIHGLRKERDDFVLDLIGDGPARPELEELSKKLGIQKHIIFHGFRQKKELPALLAQSECFLFQTDFDIWGLVLNEAMASGIPVIASPNARAVYDLVEDGKTGYICGFENPSNIIKRINLILENKERSALMGKLASDFISENASLEVSAKGFLNALDYCQKT